MEEDWVPCNQVWLAVKEYYVASGGTAEEASSAIIRRLIAFKMISGGFCHFTIEIPDGDEYLLVEKWTDDDGTRPTPSFWSLWARDPNRVADWIGAEFRFHYVDAEGKLFRGTATDVHFKNRHFPGVNFIAVTKEVVQQSYELTAIYAQKWIEGCSGRNGKNAWKAYQAELLPHVKQSTFLEMWSKTKKNPRGRPRNREKID